MKITKMVNFLSILCIILTVIVAFVQTGGDGTSVMVVLISSFLFIVASIKTKDLQKK
jgi:hypothetical protein